MRSMIVASIFLTSAISMACPELTGEYLCEGEEGPYSMVISQQVDNGVTVYSLVENNGAPTHLITDNVRREEKDGSITFWVQSRCEDQSLVSDISMENPVDEVSFLGAWNLWNDRAGDLGQSIVGNLAVGDVEYPIEEFSTCKRK